MGEHHGANKASRLSLVHHGERSASNHEEAILPPFLSEWRRQEHFRLEKGSFWTWKRTQNKQIWCFHVFLKTSKKHESFKFTTLTVFNFEVWKQKTETENRSQVVKFPAIPDTALLDLPDGATPRTKCRLAFFLGKTATRCWYDPCHSKNCSTQVLVERTNITTEVLLLSPTSCTLLETAFPIETKRQILTANVINEGLLFSSTHSVLSSWRTTKISVSSQEKKMMVWWISSSLYYRPNQKKVRKCFGMQRR